MRVAIVGAGPAGAHLAFLLSTNGCEVLLFDARREAWEKPCGGGVTTKALREFDFLRDGAAPKKIVSTVRVITARGAEVTIRPKSDFAIYSRTELDRMMRDRATSAGARLHPARIAKIQRAQHGWQLETEHGESFTADFLVGADGATSKMRRRLGVEFRPQDFIYALGWHVRSSVQNDEAAARVDIKYLNGYAGYIWAFPRTDHLSYGIATKYQEKTPRALKEHLLEFIAAQEPELAREIAASNHHPTPRASFYGAMIPALEVPVWDQLKVSCADDSWALIGDAAGFVDPITGEGIYYAIKSAELLAASMLTRPADYEAMWRAEFGAEMRRSAQILDRFYRGSFLGAPFTERMVQFARIHRGVRETLNDLIAGDQSYVDLKPRLRRDLLKFI